jgi:hypothetical protein
MKGCMQGIPEGTPRDRFAGFYENRQPGRRPRKVYELEQVSPLRYLCAINDVPVDRALIRHTRNAEAFDIFFAATLKKVDFPTETGTACVAIGRWSGSGRYHPPSRVCIVDRAAVSWPEREVIEAQAQRRLLLYRKLAEVNRDPGAGVKRAWPGDRVFPIDRSSGLVTWPSQPNLRQRFLPHTAAPNEFCHECRGCRL